MREIAEKSVSSIIERSNNANEPEWLTEIRTKAFEAYESFAWPTPEQEEWRRTNLSEYELDDEKITAALFAARPAGTTIVDLSDGTNGRGKLEVARPLLEKVAAGMDDRFAALNLSLWTESRLVYVPEGVRLAEPVFIEYFGGSGEINNTHTIVVLGRDASATVIQRFSGANPGMFWNTGVSASLDDGAELEFTNIQRIEESERFFGQLRFFLSNYSKLHSFESYTGAKLTKTRSEVFVDGSGAEAYLDGVYYTKEGQHADMRTVQYHMQRASDSRAYFKGAVSGGGRSIYQGLINVDERAPGTDAYLTNKNLILNDGARADSIPCLEIRTDDVKCSHGSTSGRLDEEALFYLMSRGLSRSQAREELISGFFEDLIHKAPAQAQDMIRSRIQELIA